MGHGSGGASSSSAYLKMAGKRHHTIPKFLLKGFASSTRGKIVKTWQYAKGLPAVEKNINEISVEGYFYGKEDESDLDARITNLEEQQYAPLVQQLRMVDPKSPEVTHAGIAALVVHLNMRTRQVRDSVAVLMDRMLDSAEEKFQRDDVIRVLLARELKGDGQVRDAFKSTLLSRGLPAERLEEVMSEVDANLPEVVNEIMPLFKAGLPETLAAEIGFRRSIIPEAVRSGFIDSMSRNLNGEERIESYSKLKWFVLTPDPPIILGDTVCVFETTGERRFRPMDVGEDPAHRIYLPLSSTQVLVGTPYRSRPKVDAQILNRAVARCSFEYFVSSQEIHGASGLISGLGRWSGLMSAAQIQKMEDDLVQDLLVGAYRM
jgi:hypothetical protein